MTVTPAYHVLALYQFVKLVDLPALKAKLLPEFAALEMCGSLLLASEGLNGTMAAPTRAQLESAIALLRQHCGFTADDNIKFSTAPAKPFNKLKIRLKQEIITFKQPGANPTERVGAYVPAAEWNALLQDPDVVLLDTRNDYETTIGTFTGAVVPPLQHFTQFASWVRGNLNPQQHKKVAMFCTGGIRCEKASAFMLAEGFAEVYHLQGGILKYLEEVPADQSQWQGDCYVFDKRMAVGHGLKTGHYSMCFSCGAALDDAARAHELYEPGVACHHCAHTTTAEDKARFRERQMQLSAC